MAHAAIPRQLEVTVNIPPCKTLEECDLRESFRWKVVAAQPLFEGTTDAAACMAPVGSFVEYELPFRLRLVSFRLGFGACFASSFTDWTLEALDPELEDTTTDSWRVLFDSGGRSPWTGTVIPFGEVVTSPLKTFQLDAPFEASHFRIRIVRKAQCSHVRAFDLFGTILPPWSL